MSMIRSIAILILVLAVLPWGAFSAVFVHRASVMAQPETNFTSVEPDQAQFLSAQDDGRGWAIVAPPQKRCRTAALIGAACGPDVALPASGAQLAPVVATDLVLPADTPPPIEAAPMNEPDPPRFC